MKNLKLLPLLLLLIIFSSCVERIETIRTKEHMVTINPEFSVEKETLKSRIAAIIPAEEISFNPSKTTASGEADFHALSVKIVTDSFPSGIAFYKISDEIRTAVESGVSNMDDYQKLNILVQHEILENGIKRRRSHEKEIDL